jgi:hypothetical protein
MLRPYLESVNRVLLSYDKVTTFNVERSCLTSLVSTKNLGSIRDEDLQERVTKTLHRNYHMFCFQLVFVMPLSEVLNVLNSRREPLLLDLAALRMSTDFPGIIS